MATPGSHENKRAAALRMLALECRAVAESFSTRETRAQMLRIADSYDDMACTLDDLAEHERQIALA
jgi:hypothetical protein